MEDLRFGLQLTLLGMGLVFALLALLWGLLALLQRLDGTPMTAQDVAEDVGLATQPAAPASELTAEALAAITIAVLAHAAVLRAQAAPHMRSVWPGRQLFASRWVAGGRARQNRSWQRRG